MSPPVVGGEGHADVATAPNAPFGLGPNPSADLLRPAGAIGETVPRGMGGPRTTIAAALSTGQIWLESVPLEVGRLAQSITWFNNGAGSAMTNQWSALFDEAGNLLAISPDDTSNAWGANTPKTFTFVNAFRILRTARYVIGVVVVGTPPTLLGYADTVSGPIARAPALAGTSTAGLTNPASCPNPVTLPTGGNGARTYAIVNGV